MRGGLAVPNARIGKGDEAPRVPCADDPWPYDVLMDRTAGPEFRAAVEAATALCKTCPIWRECFTANRGRQWTRSIATQGQRRPSTRTASCGKPRGRDQHLRRDEHPCDECSAAYNAYQRGRRAQRKKAAA